MRTVRTFDVFDTLLTRRVVDPTSVFLLAGRQLATLGIETLSPERFARLRARAENDMVKVTERGHPPLSTIYERVAVQAGLSQHHVERLVALEIELERCLVVPVPAGVERLEAARRAGHVIAFVSDMYLPTEVVRELLAMHGLVRDGEPVFVSVEGNGSKSRGDLYAHVLDTLGATATDVTHCGDSAHGDVRRARDNGIAADHFTAAHPNRYERILEEHRWETDGLSSLFAGASRLCRLNGSGASNHLRVVRDVTASVVSPLLVGYVLWVLRTAQRRGLSRLYFVARDGEILLDVARRLDASLHTGIDLQYLYGSRQAWFPAGADPDHPEGALDVLAHETDTSLVGLLERCGVNPSDWVPDSAGQLEGVLARAELDRLRADPRFLAAVSDGLRGRHARLESYLRHVGLYDGVPSGVVDLGWRGLALHHLAFLLERTGADVPVGLYMAAPSEPLRQTVESWSPRGTRVVRPFMVEIFCAGTHGQTIDFKTDTAGVPVPVLRGDRNLEALDWGLDELRSTVDAFVDRLLEVVDLASLDADMRPSADAVFTEFFEFPTIEEARVWGTFPYERDLSSERRDRLAHGRTIRRAMLHRVRPEHVRIRWPAGSEVLSSRPWRVAQIAGTSARRLAVRAARRLFRRFPRGGGH